MNEKISLAEARARRADPVWQRRHRMADITGAVLVALLFLVPLVAGLVSLTVGLLVAVSVLIGATAAVGASGPTVGMERRAALLVGIPIVGGLVLVPSVWRAAHLHLQHWQGPLQPPWENGPWIAAAVVSGLSWLATAVGLLLLLT